MNIIISGFIKLECSYVFFTFKRALLEKKIEKPLRFLNAVALKYAYYCETILSTDTCYH